MTAEASDRTEAPDPSRDGSALVEVERGRRLFARWAGAPLGGPREGSAPLVLLEAGLGETHAAWEPVLERIGASAPVLAYDRAGRGRSDPRAHPDLPWTGADMADDARRLLGALKVNRHVVVVGHSFGGLVARMYVDRYPFAVTGLVLLDPVGGAADIGVEDAGAEAMDAAASLAQVQSARPLLGRPVAVLQRAAPDAVVQAIHETVAAAMRWAAGRGPKPQLVRCIVTGQSAEADGAAPGPGVLLVPAAGQGTPAGEDASQPWQLPATELSPKGWIASEVGRIARQMEQQLGGRFSVLRHLSELDTESVCLLEAHDPAWMPPAGSRWVALSELRAMDLESLAGDARAAAALTRWLDEQEGAATAPSIRPPWERPGWMAEAVCWADAELGRIGAERTGRPEHTKGAWSGSTILKLPTTQGDLYLKEAYSRPPGEAALVDALRLRWPKHLPDVVAVGAEGRRMLMRDFGRGRLYGLPVTAWEESARQFAQLQLACAAEVDRWLAMGCEDRSPHRFPALLGGMLADGIVLGRGTSWGLTEIELAEMRALVPQVLEICAALQDSGVPMSLVQQDFREGNLAVGPTEGGARRFIFYDWGDTIVSHPFFSGIRMLDYISQPYETPVSGPSGVPTRVTLRPLAHRRYVRDAYLEPWSEYGSPAHLRNVFTMAQRLNPLWQSVRWWLELPYYEPGCPWFLSIAEWGPGGVRWGMRTLASPTP